MIRDPASFRDPSGYVFSDGGKVFRRIRKAGLKDYSIVRDNSAVHDLIASGTLIGFEERADHGFPFDRDDIVLEHPRLPFISYPYEWPFDMLKSAALLHLDIQIRMLDQGITLKDATAFNIQFSSARPVFIDILSFKRYEDGEPWMGHRQFVQQFLNPLVLSAVVGAPYHNWYRGSPSGIGSRDLNQLLKTRHKFSPVLLSHVVLPSKVEGSLQGQPLRKAGSLRSHTLPKSRYLAILLQLKRYIESLSVSGQAKSVWQDYERNNTYDAGEANKKRAFVQAFTRDVRPSLLVDIGCNSGEYSQAALEAGASLVVGVDGDNGALRAACGRAVENSLALIPIHQDLTDPSPPTGWNASERVGFWDRAAQADGVLALALIHHIVIGGNIPLEAAVDRLVATAPRGVIEFVPKGDPTVDHMLSTREDVFPDYNVENFVNALSARAAIVKRERISDSGREVFWFERR